MSETKTSTPTTETALPVSIHATLLAFAAAFVASGKAAPHWDAITSATATMGDKDGARALRALREPTLRATAQVITKVSVTATGTKSSAALNLAKGLASIKPKDDSAKALVALAKAAFKRTSLVLAAYGAATEYETK